MNRSVILSILIIGTSAGTMYARGFGGGFGGGGFHGGGAYGGYDGAAGYGIRGAGELDANSIRGSGGLWGDGIHGSGGLGGGGAGIYGGFGNSFRGGGYGSGGRNFGGANGLNAEQGMGGPQGNFSAPRQSFNSGLANLGLQTGGFRAGQFGPMSSDARGYGSLDGVRPGSLPSAGQLNSFLGLPSDMGIHQAGSMEHPYGYAGSAEGLAAFDPISAGMRNASGRVYEEPDGTTVAHGSAGERGVVAGSSRAAAGERGVSGTVVKGPDGTTVARASAGERGAVVGPNGAAGGSRTASGTAVRGPQGNVAARGSEVTRDWSAADMRVQGNFARSNFHDNNAFGRDWYGQHPGAWRALGYGAGVWTAADWAGINGWFGDDWPVYGYNYGNDLTYQNNNVYLYGQPIATADDYYQSAADLAESGEQAQIPSEPPPTANAQPDPKNAKWLPLGVFEAIPAGEKSSKMLMQLTVNKAGVIRGNYYNTGDHNVQRIEGSIDKKTSRVAWVVADKKEVIFDTGLYNLTQNESTVLVHFGKDKNEQWTLVRLKQPPSGTTKQ